MSVDKLWQEIIFFKSYVENEAVRLVPEIILFLKYAKYEIKASGL